MFQKVELNFTSPAHYTDGVDWIRNHVVLKSASPSSVLQLEIMLPGGKVILYMKPRGHYILGFRGADKIYLLDDSTETEAFMTHLPKDESGLAPQILVGLSSSHGVHGLNSFGCVDFTVADLESAFGKLSNYQFKTMNFVSIKRPLSLLVFMVAESARFPMLQRRFERMYFGQSVAPDQAVKVYSKAKALMRLSDKAFPMELYVYGVERLVKRAIELEELFHTIDKFCQNTSDKKRLIEELRAGKTLSCNKIADESVKRLSVVVNKELDKLTPEDFSTLRNLYKNNIAVWAAQAGVALPPIGIDVPDGL